MKHVNKYVECAVGVVYKIPLGCGKVYIGQTGRCLNERLREHALSLRSTTGAHLHIHCRDCRCIPNFQGTTIVGRGKEKVAREVLEAYMIKKECPDKCISQPSLFLHKKEVDFIDTCGGRVIDD